MGDCDRYKKYYSNYLEQKIDPMIMREIDQHLNHCDKCKKIIRQIGLLQKIMADLPAKRCSENFNLRLHQKIFNRSTREGSTMVKKYSYAFSFVIATALVAFFIYNHFNNKEQVMDVPQIGSYSETESAVTGNANPVVDAVDFDQNNEGINIKTKSHDDLVSDSSNYKRSRIKSPNLKYVGQEK